MKKTEIGIFVTISLMLIFLLPQNVEARTPCQVIHGPEISFLYSDVVFFGNVVSAKYFERNPTYPPGAGVVFDETDNKLVVKFENGTTKPFVHTDTIKFNVKESYKGFSNQTIILISDGYHYFVEGNNYLVYAVNHSGVFFPSNCFDITKNPNIIHLSKLRAFSITEPSVLAQESINVMSGQNPYFPLLILFGIVVFFSLIFYFATWVIVKRILHKRHPKLIGVIVVIVVDVIWITVTQFQ